MYVCVYVCMYALVRAAFFLRVQIFNSILFEAAFIVSEKNVKSLNISMANTVNPAHVRDVETLQSANLQISRLL